MRQVFVLGMIAVGVVALVPTSGASAGDRPQVICWKFDRSGMHKTYRTAPRKCFVFKHGATANAEGAASIRHAHWRWRNGRAKGKGKLGISTVGAVPARFRLTKPIDRCGHTVFSKINVRYRIPSGPQYPGGPDLDGDKGHYSFHTYTC